VARLGMSMGRITMMARLPLVVGEWYLAQSSVNRSVSQVYRVLTPGALPVAVGAPVVHPPAQHFPWGEIVDPD